MVIPGSPLSCAWTCLHYKGLYCPWTRHNRSLCCSWTCLYYRACAAPAPGHHIGLCCAWTWLRNMPILQRHVVHLDLCKQNRGLHLDMSGQQEPVLVWTYLYHRGLRCTWTCPHHKGPSSCTWTCLDKRSLCWPSTCLCTTGVWTAPASVWKTGACAGLDISTPQGPELCLDVSGKQERLLVWIYPLSTS
jgi:hypothetical protein